MFHIYVSLREDNQETYDQRWVFLQSLEFKQQKIKRAYQTPGKGIFLHWKKGFNEPSSLESAANQQWCGFMVDLLLIFDWFP